METGAVLSVPSDDDRDFAFSKKYNIPFNVVLEPTSAPKGKTVVEFKAEVYAKEAFTHGHVGIIVNSCSEMLDLNGLTIQKAKDKSEGLA